MSEKSGDRRQHPRFAIEIQARGRTSDQPEPADLRTENLSLAGLSCSSNVGYPIQTEVAVSLKLPSNGGSSSSRSTVELDAVVVRREEVLADDGSRQYRMALFFTDLEPEALETLCSYFDALDDPR